ncbi:hypothetical protein [Jejuia spongiicola]|uniref:Uncharacterized protein n=1 Tax=Jejuia spongiicola TaxID=2942207 RepID=A0ABT0QG54_9FLAO|nr:hypothetical protein [Jejuia spongiicola]MCL6294910.1 hypothetical protein [Jejuia spongiicola]
MHPFLLIAVAIGVGKLFAKIFKNNPELGEITHKDIYKDFLIDIDKNDLTERILKQKTTRSINLIIEKHKSFKIGKTGNPKSRTANHKIYDRMFLLCSSSDKEMINVLEGHYNDKYLTHKKNDNKKGGSAGDAKAMNGRYYLYIVTINKG